MIKIIAGGKKNSGWVLDAASEYEKRLRKPFDISWQFMEEAKFAKFLETWPFDHSKEYVILCDERGKNISSREYSDLLKNAFLQNRDVVILIGGAYGFTDADRAKADFLWGYSRLVFPHMLARVIAVEQTYRAEQIYEGRPYHHE